MNEKIANEITAKNIDAYKAIKSYASDRVEINECAESENMNFSDVLTPKGELEGTMFIKDLYLVLEELFNKIEMTNKYANMYYHMNEFMTKYKNPLYLYLYLLRFLCGTKEKIQQGNLKQD